VELTFLSEGEGAKRGSFVAVEARPRLAVNLVLFPAMRRLSGLRRAGSSVANSPLETSG
jgi:hypothetical protein